MTFEKKISLDPIGFVRTQAVGNEVKDKSRLSEIFIDCDFNQALDGISGFSHVFVLFWLHQITGKEREDVESSSAGQT